MNNKITLPNGTNIDLNCVESISKLTVGDNFNGLFLNKNYLYYYIVMKSGDNYRLNSNYHKMKLDIYRQESDFVKQYNDLVESWKNIN